MGVKQQNKSKQRARAQKGNEWIAYCVAAIRSLPRRRSYFEPAINNRLDATT